MMVARPVYTPTNDPKSWVAQNNIEFKWVPGLAYSQKIKRIENLHEAAKSQLGLQNILEVSTKSSNKVGVALSAFNLEIIAPKSGRRFSVESAYQSSKAFSGGGPYKEILLMDSHAAKADPRLKNSGELVGFSFFGSAWSLHPFAAFYNWLYLNALYRSPLLNNQIYEYDGFTDIEFNPKKSTNCQAYSVALYVSLVKCNLLDEAMKSKEYFMRTIYGEEGDITQASINQGQSFSLF